MDQSPGNRPAEPVAEPPVPGSQVARKDRFRANLAALWQTDRELAKKLDGLPEDQRLELEPSRSGLPTARAVGPDGKARYLHSRYDPRREAASLVDGQVRQEALCYVVFGLGLGYLPAELLDRLPLDGSVVVVEPDPATLATALELHDWSEPIRQTRLTFLTRGDAGHVHQQLGPQATRIIAGTRLIQGLASEGQAGPFFAQIRQAVADFVAFARMAVVTLLLNNEITAANICGNLAHYLAAPSLGMLRNRFAGRAAVVASAGPSLGRCLPTLRQLADRAVVIAVQTALRPLLEAGIRPHFATTLDYHAISQRFFQDLPAGGLAGVHLVAEPKANWQVIDAFVAAAADADRPATVTMLGNDFAETLLGELAPGRERLPAGATVAHLAFYLAQHLGCDPIVLVGQDLGFSNGCYYTPGTAIHRLWAGELNRFNSLESMEWQRIVRDPQGLRRLTDVHGRPIYTDEQMFTYLRQFERDFANAPQQVIDATGGGVAKAATTVMDLEEVGRRFAATPLPPDALDYRQQVNWFDPSRLAGATDKLARRIEQVAQLKDVCRRTLELLGKLDELLDSDPAGFNRTLANMDELRAWVGQHEDVLQLVSQVSQVAEFQRFTADRTLRIKATEGVEKRRFQLARDRAYVAAVADGCDRLTAILQTGRSRLSRPIPGTGQAGGSPHSGRPTDGVPQTAGGDRPGGR